MKTAMMILAAFISVAALAQDGELVLIKGGRITPEGAAASIEQLSSNAVAAASAAAAGAAAAAAADEVAGIVGGVTDIVNSLEGVGFIRGFLLDYGVSESAPNTNATVNVVKFVPNVSNDVVYAYCDLYTYFSEEPASFPRSRWSTSLRADAEWNEAESVGVELTNVVVGGFDYECYRNTVRVPVAYSNAFFRIYAEATQGTVGAYLPVQQGVQPGSHEPLTGSWMIGTNRISVVGGIIPQ